MEFSQDSIKPIYLQVAEWLEDEILKGNLKEEEQVLSKNQFASLYNINPATANKGINILVDENILYKKRGIGMFVAVGAKEIIISKRKEGFCREFIDKLLYEADKLGMTKEEVIEIIKKR
ncbi:GntR family transcriptional regulator [Clostridium sp. 19966]|uniref:GntR family transcriptional regulator n=1 Tax=Clostridium sp. 19966 TaxID=2768166 RepID=UPI0028E03E49|nr:GntR family transcriptional regulator [Clostridium sp. 19966]MDT8717932.1 GntR family transcriptional regulator [Clostridium sp. 19966]